MFRQEGQQRSHQHNQLLAGYLASVAGFVNSAGFILLGSFTSHVTGNVGRLADDVAEHRSAAALAAVMILAYFGGAFVASMVIESDAFRRRVNVYGVLLVVEASLLAAFAGLSYIVNTNNPHFKDLEGVLLCIAMGLQNSLVTRLSGAVVRTTHLTGVVTDLGIEAARWFRLWRHRIGRQTHLRLVVGVTTTPEPQIRQAFLLLTIFIGFIVGSVLGAVCTLHWFEAAFLIPTVALAIGGAFALRMGSGLDLRARE